MAKFLVLRCKTLLRLTDAAPVIVFPFRCFSVDVYPAEDRDFSESNHFRNYIRRLNDVLELDIKRQRISRSDLFRKTFREVMLRLDQAKKEGYSHTQMGLNEVISSLASLMVSKSLKPEEILHIVHLVVYNLPPFTRSTAAFACLGGEVLKVMSKCDFSEAPVHVVYEWINLMIIFDIMNRGATGQLLYRSLVQRVASFSDVEFVVLMSRFWQQKVFPKTLQPLVETEIVKRFYRFSLMDIALISLAYFRTLQKIANTDIISQIASRLFESLDEQRADSVVVTAIFKELRFVESSELLRHVPRIIRRFANLPLDTFTIQTWVHAALFCTRTCFFEESFAKGLCTKVASNIHAVRSKDASFVLHYLAMFDYDQPLSNANDSDSEATVFRFLLNHFDTGQFRMEIEDFPEVLTSALRCAAIRNLYPRALLSLVFSEKYFRRYREAQRHFFPDLDLFFVDGSCAIDQPDHLIPRLDYTMLLEFRHSKKSKLPNFSTDGKRIAAFQNLSAALVAKFNCAPSAIYCGQVLPHIFSSDILLKVKNGQLMNVNVELSWRPYTRAELTVPADETWIVILVKRINTCRLYTFHWLGPIVARKRQLLSLGYRIIEVSFARLPI
ncbi:unnamed protein product [Soboliphyme baturini]|uniref:RAP domain-containing protein n=1 Tax=Soboliphyme baturini TaxID=241478 RepID=A0A183IV41_9BILA|nr:unnamed protein product [Soboliphyme baturini]